MDRALAASGLLVVAIDMTLAPEAPYPASVQDANYAVRWLKWKAASWNGDPSTIGIYGSSSGGHVAELLGMRPRDARYNAIPLPEAPHVDATVSLHRDALAGQQPVRALPERRADEARRHDEEQHRSYFKPWETIHESNPQEILDRHEPVTLVAAPHHAGRARRQRAAGRAGEIRRRPTRPPAATCQFQVFEGCEHEWVAKPGPQTDRAREMVKAFIARQLKTPRRA